MIEKNPCPFCGSSDLMVEDITYDYGPTVTKFFVVCCNCSAQGPEIGEEDEEGGCYHEHDELMKKKSIEAWNNCFNRWGKK